MANAYLRANLFVKNCPVSIIGSESTVMVARLVDTELRYYGLYDTWERAQEIAKELGNGVVFEIDNENRLNADMVVMLTELKTEIEKKKFLESSCSFMDKTEEKNYAVYTDDISKVILQKINSLKED